MSIYTSAYLLVVLSLVLLDHRLQLPLVVSRVLRADTIHFTLKYWADPCCDLCIYALDSGRSGQLNGRRQKNTASSTSDQGTPPKSGRCPVERYITDILLCLDSAVRLLCYWWSSR